MLAFTACDSRPDGVLSEETMEELMVEMYLLEGDASVIDSTYNTDFKTPYYNALLTKHGVTAAQFDSSMIYYYTQGKAIEQLHKRVVDRLEKMQADSIWNNE